MRSSPPGTYASKMIVRGWLWWGSSSADVPNPPPRAWRTSDRLALPCRSTCWSSAVLNRRITPRLGRHCRCRAAVRCLRIVKPGEVIRSGRQIGKRVHLKLEGTTRRSPCHRDTPHRQLRSLPSGFCGSRAIEGRSTQDHGGRRRPTASHNPRFLTQCQRSGGAAGQLVAWRH